MAGINTGILANAYPCSIEQIKELEKQVLENKKAFVYLDEKNKLCFIIPYGIEDIKDLAWHTVFELTKDSGVFIKKVYRKNSLSTFFLEEILQKHNLDDTWSTANHAGLLDESLLDEFILE